MYVWKPGTQQHNWKVPEASQFQPYGLRQFLQDAALVLGLVATVRSLKRR